MNKLYPTHEDSCILNNPSWIAKSESSCTCSVNKLTKLERGVPFQVDQSWLFISPIGYGKLMGPFVTKEEATERAEKMRKEGQENE